MLVKAITPNTNARNVLVKKFDISVTFSRHLTFYLFFPQKQAVCEGSIRILNAIVIQLCHVFLAKRMYEHRCHKGEKWHEDSRSDHHGQTRIILLHLHDENGLTAQSNHGCWQAESFDQLDLSTQDSLIDGLFMFFVRRQILILMFILKRLTNFLAIFGQSSMKLSLHFEIISLELDISLVEGRKENFPFWSSTESHVCLFIFKTEQTAATEKPLLSCRVFSAICIP